jgi:2-haloalkanoic acid dehalogenase type II
MKARHLPPPAAGCSSRRELLGRVAAAGVLTAGHAVGSRAQVKAIAFDAFPILDPRPVFAFGEELFPGKGADLANTWRTRQFEYMWLRTMSRQYADFRKVTEDALIFTAKMLKLELTSDKRDRLMGTYLAIRCWPEVPAALHSLGDAGARLAFLSNMMQKMLEAASATQDSKALSSTCSARTASRFTNLIRAPIKWVWTPFVSGARRSSSQHLRNGIQPARRRSVIRRFGSTVRTSPRKNLE